MKNVNKKTILLVLIDIVSVIVSYLLALGLYFDFDRAHVSKGLFENTGLILLVMIILKLVVFLLCKMYRGVWRLAGVAEALNSLISGAILLPFDIAAVLIMRFAGVELSIAIVGIGCVIDLIVSVTARFSYRLLRRLYKNQENNDKAENIMLIGAGSSGQNLIREYADNSAMRGRVVCIIDDNPAKRGKYLEGVPIVGNRDSIVKNAVKYDVDKIIFAISGINPTEKGKILKICQQTECEIRTVPAVGEMLNEDVSIKHVREVKIEDLLGREVQVLDNKDAVTRAGKDTVMITGGGGSIGSELCRQIASYNPKKLIIFDIYENSTYDIQQELRTKFPELHPEVLIGDMTDAVRVDHILDKYRPDVIFHAAAHKHVPLMEDSPNEAIKNNVFGTLNLCESAIKYDVRKFVLISTDKAVNPTNIMGASKRICEMIIQSMNGRGVTQFVAVRFGNVLGSNGSVVPLFKKQIEAGGPVTVTDPRIIRYFMTIPEAVSLVLQAAIYARGGEIYVLDMGEPVKIDDMARNLIKLSGFTPDKDIKIVYTGLRPGEKLYEELLMSEEGLQETENKRIFIAKPIEMDTEEFYKELEELRDACHREDDSIRDKVSEIVPTYRK